MPVILIIAVIIVLGSMRFVSRLYRPGSGQLKGSGSVFVDLKDQLTIDERKEFPLTGINAITINTASENVTIHTGSGKAVTAWYHGTVAVASPALAPHLIVQQQGSTLDIHIARDAHADSYAENTELEVTIPKEYAGKLLAESASGNITLDDHHFAALSLTTASGNISAGKIHAATLAAKTASGDIQIQSLAGDSVDTSSRSGTAGGQRLIDARIYTDSGNVSLNCINPLGNITLKSTSGDLRLRLPMNSAFTLQARSTSGDVACDFPVTSSSCDDHHITGTVGKGEHTVAADTTSGNITISR